MGIFVNLFEPILDHYEPIIHIVGIALYVFDATSNIGSRHSIPSFYRQ